MSDVRLAQIERVVSGHCPCGCGGGVTDCKQVRQTLQQKADLLAALEAIRAAALNDNRGLTEALALADAAIAKAKGGPA